MPNYPYRYLKGYSCRTFICKYKTVFTTGYLSGEKFVGEK